MSPSKGSAGREGLFFPCRSRFLLVTTVELVSRLLLRVLAWRLHFMSIGRCRRPHHLLQEIAVPKRFAAGGGAADDVNIIPLDTWALQEHGEPCSATPKARVEIGDALIRHIHPAHDVIVIINHRGYFNFRRQPPPPYALSI